MIQAYERLEQEFSDFVGMGFGEMVACSSGTAALHLAFEALELPQGSEILMSDFNMIACPRAATLAGLVPYFIDCNSNDLLINTGLLDEESKRMDASGVLFTHIYGRHCNVDWGNNLPPNESFAVIEDMSEIHGIKPHPDTNAACWSFYKNKIIHGEEGGMIWFKNVGRARIAKELRSLGFNAEHNFLHRPRGHNYRMSNAHAELILDSLAKYPENSAKRRQVEDWYNKHIPKQWQQPYREAVWVYDIRVPDLGYQRMDFIIRELNAKGVAARHGFRPMSMQEEYSSQTKLTCNPNAEKASQEVLYLPVNPSITESEVQANTEALINAWRDSNQLVAPTYPARTPR